MTPAFQDPARGDEWTPLRTRLQAETEKAGLRGVIVTGPGRATPDGVIVLTVVARGDRGR